MLKKFLIVFLTIFTTIGLSYAENRCLSKTEITPSKVKKALKNISPNADVKVISVLPSPIKGLYEVVIEAEGRKLPIYVDCSLKYMVSGEIVDIEKRKSITRERLKEIMMKENEEKINNLKKIIGEKKLKKLIDVVGVAGLSRFDIVDLKNIPSEGKIVYGNKNSKLTVIVITDPQCPFCKRLHKFIKEVLKDEDVNFQIVMLPLPFHQYAEGLSKAVICQPSNEKAKKMLDKIFENQSDEFELMTISKKYQCSNGEKILQKHKKFARTVNANGTPTIIFVIGKNKGLKTSGAYPPYLLGEIIDALK